MRTHLRVLLVCHSVLSRRLCGDSVDVLADLLKPLRRYDMSSHRNHSSLRCSACEC